MVSTLINNYAGRFAVVEYHVDDAYAVPWGESRGNFYSIWSDGIPWFAYDGLFDAWPINTYESKLLQRMAVPTPVTMEVSVTPLGGNDYRIATTVCLESGATALTARIHAVVVEDRYPTNPSYSRNTFRLATPTGDVSLAPGDCRVVTRDVTLNPAWNADNLKVIAWAQTPSQSAPAEVYQAAQVQGPFDLTPGDLDGDGDVDFDDLNILLAAYGSATGDPNYNADADLDSDGDIDFDDLNQLLAVYGA